VAKGEEIPKTNPSEIENLIEQIRGTNLEPGSKEKIERLLRTVLVLVELLQRKIPPSKSCFRLSTGKAPRGIKRRRQRIRIVRGNPKKQGMVSLEPATVNRREVSRAPLKANGGQARKGMDAGLHPTTAGRRSSTVGMKT